jgi:hypothetical protein
MTDGRPVKNNGLRGGLAGIARIRSLTRRPDPRNPRYSRAWSRRVPPARAPVCPLRRREAAVHGRRCP